MIAGFTPRSLFATGLLTIAVTACSEAPTQQQRGGESLGSLEQPVLEAANIFGNNLPAKTVVLTYDDGPDEHTLELAKYLNEQGIKATFFINGRRFCKVWNGDVCMTPVETRGCNDGQAQAPVAAPIYYHESILDEVIALGHRIGNHTTDHCHLKGQDNPPDFEFEVKTTQEIVERHVCDGIFLFRAPFGDWDGQASNIAKSFPGLDKLVGPINWDVDGGDWDCYQKGKTIEECGNGYLTLLDKRANKNGIFLNHDRPEFNVGIDAPLKLAQYLVPKLKEQGYTFSTLDALLNLTPNGPLGCPLPVGGAGGMGGMGGAGGTGGTSGAGGGAGVGGVAGGAGTGGTMAGTGGTGGGASGSPVMTPGGTATVVTPAEPENDSSCGVARRPASGSFALVAMAALGALARRRQRRP
jgi:MYXO-CTERM domain-containing protein